MNDDQSNQPYGDADRVEKRYQASVNTRNLLAQHVVLPLQVKFQIKDVCEIIVGASVLAIPVAYTEEVWKLGEHLPAANVVAVAVTSITIVALFVYFIYYQNNLRENFAQYSLRVVACYFITLLVVAVILAMFQKLPWQTDSAIALRRMILVGFPACFSATVVDSLK